MRDGIALPRKIATYHGIPAAVPQDSAVPLMPLAVRGLDIRVDGHVAVDSLDLDLGQDGLTAIMGPNGAGKTLLLKVLHGLIPADGGSISWNGFRPGRHITRRQAMVFQTPALLRRSTQANVAFVLNARGGDPRRAEDLLRRVDLLEKARQPARRLSGGEQQRLALARALATDPEILFLDEPTASLDPGATRKVEAIIRDLRQQGQRVILVTHDSGQARRLADDVVFLNRGRLAEHSPAADFFSRPKSDAAQAYLNGVLL